MSWNMFVITIILALAVIVAWLAGIIAVSDYIVEKQAYRRSKARSIGVTMMSWLGLYLLIRNQKLHGRFRGPKHSYRPNVRILSTYKNRKASKNEEVAD